MPVYVISYDLKNGPVEEYEELFEAIKELADTWFHVLESVWLITAKGPATTIRDSLAAHLGAKDKLLVARLGKGHATGGAFSQKGKTWLTNNMPKS